jgi:hypothetical protein
MNGPIWFYTYFGSNSGEMSTIGTVYYGGRDDPRARAVLISGIWTTDVEQAERWRLMLAAGKLPDLAADPPICDEDQVSARIDEIPIVSGDISIE